MNSINIEIFKKYLIWFLITVLIFQSIVIIKFLLQNKDKNNIGVLEKDTNLLLRYQNEVKKDTVIKFFEKIVHKKSEPEKIYYQKTDTQFIEKTKELDLILKMNKKDRKLIIETINQNGKTIKEYIFDDVNKDFDVISQKSNIYVKSRTFYWNKINAILNFNWLIPDKKKIQYGIGVETGINYKSKIDLNTGVLYLPNEKNILLNSNIKIKF